VGGGMWVSSVRMFKTGRRRKGLPAGTCRSRQKAKPSPPVEVSDHVTALTPGRERIAVVRRLIGSGWSGRRLHLLQGRHAASAAERGGRRPRPWHRTADQRERRHLDPPPPWSRLKEGSGKPGSAVLVDLGSAAEVGAT
jgi:hypothetical protein